MLSVFMTPWTKPTSIHRATSDACAATTASNSARYGLLGLGGRRVVPGDRVVGQPAQQVDVAGGARRTGSCRPAGGCSPPGRGRRPAAAVSRRTGRPVATTASERVVGMPRACIASLTTYSRSIGPTAASPSPPRANGVRPEPLRCRSRRRPSASTSSPSSRARPSPSRGDVAAELVPGVGLGHRRGAVGDARCRPAAARPSGLRSHAGSSPSSAASGSLSTSSRGSGASSACHGQRQLGQLPGEPVAQGDGRCRCDAHPAEGTDDGTIVRTPTGGLHAGPAPPAAHDDRRQPAPARLADRPRPARPPVPAAGAGRGAVADPGAVPPGGAGRRDPGRDPVAGGGRARRRHRRGDPPRVLLQPLRDRAGRARPRAPRARVRNRSGIDIPVPRVVGEIRRPRAGPGRRRPVPARAHRPRRSRSPCPGRSPWPSRRRTTTTPTTARWPWPTPTSSARRSPTCSRPAPTSCSSTSRGCRPARRWPAGTAPRR